MCNQKATMQYDIKLCFIVLKETMAYLLSQFTFNPKPKSNMPPYRFGQCVLIHSLL